MKEYRSCSLRAMTKGGMSYLSTYGETVDDVKAEIDRANARAIKLGYKATQYIITCTDFTRWEDSNGNFVKSECIEYALDTYPRNI